ncbi:MAG: hypothetical protein R3B48_23720 [Kofleriaceae bacterium]
MTLSIAGTDLEVEDGRAYLRRAAELWSLIDVKRGAAISAWLEQEWGAHDTDPDLEVYDVGCLPRLLGLLEGLEAALQAQVTDAKFRVDAATAARISAQHELLIDSWVGDDGPVYTLSNRIGELHEVVALIKKAVAMQRGLEVG